MGNLLGSAVKALKYDLQTTKILGSWARQRVRKTIQKAAIGRQSRDFTAAMIGGGVTSAPPDLPTLTEEEIHNPVIWRVLELPAEDAASCRLIAKEGTEDDPGEEIPAREMEPLEVLTRVNPVDDSVSFKKQVFKDARGAGDAFYFQHLTRAGKPMALERMLPNEITPLPGKNILGGYSWSTPDAQGRLQQHGAVDRAFIPVEKMFHFRNGSNPHTNLRGMGFLERLRYQIAMGQTMDDWNFNRYAKGIPTEYMVFYNGRFTPGEREEKEEILRQKFSGANGDNFMLVDADANGEKTWEVKLFPRPTEDELAFLDSEERIKYRIAMAGGVPPNKLQDFSQSTRIANADAMERLYWEDTIQNNLHRPFLAYLNQTWLPRHWPELVGKVFFEFDYSEVRALQKSAVEQATVLVQLTNGMILAPNEARIELGKKPLEVFDANGENIMDKPHFNGRPVGENPLSMADLFGMPGSGSTPRTPRTEEDDTEIDEDEDAMETTPDEVEDAKRALEQAGKLIQISHLKTRLAVEKMIPRDLIDLELEKRLLDKLVRIKLRRMIQRAGEQALDLAGISGVFDMLDPRVIEALEMQMVSLKKVPETVNQRVRLATAHGLEQGLPIASMRSRIQDALQASREPYQLDRISRTEVHTAAESGSLEASRQNGVEMKRWITARDSKVRGLEISDDADHDGIERMGPIAIDQPFVDPRSGARLMHPGDRRGAVTGADTINCRCTWVPDFSHLDLSSKAHKAEKDSTVSWFEKASLQDEMESDLKRTVKSYLLGLERRILANYDNQARETLEGGANAV